MTPQKKRAIQARIDNKPQGQVGQLWVYTGENLGDFVNGRIYEQIRPSINEYTAFKRFNKCGEGIEDGYSGRNHKFFRPATLEEIEKHWPTIKSADDIQDGMIVIDNKGILRVCIGRNLLSSTNGGYPLSSISENIPNIIKQVYKVRDGVELRGNFNFWFCNDSKHVLDKCELIYDGKVKLTRKEIAEKFGYNVDQLDIID